MNEWGINDVYKKGTYMQQDASGMTFQVQADDTDRFQLLCDEGITWIQAERQHLDEFFAAARKAVGQRGSAVLAGLDAHCGRQHHHHSQDDVRASHADSRQLDGPDAHEPATADSKAGGGDRADLEREQTAQVCLPKQAHAVDYYHNLRARSSRRLQSKKLPPTSIVQMDENIIEYINVIFSPGFIMKGEPQGPQRVRQAFQEDLVLYDQIVNGANERAKKVLMQMFPPKPPENMAWQTLSLIRSTTSCRWTPGSTGSRVTLAGRSTS